MTHTPLPWELKELEVKEEPLTLHAIDPKNNRRFCIATIWGEDCDTEVTSMSQANAEFIHRACNAHYDLVSALYLAKEKLASFIDVPVDECVGDYFKTINNALNQGKGD
ncbi:hypothetical protein LZG74_25380 [Dyadobacter sp. CY327]|uniref:hypothetical protein n=1 Tax=Dyadobacter sp. CY327 TaxID=2907301 RepID=UPI001F1D3043|nr:hypothetical protein [Dyadobacter sp. CY327]MCE7073667.1 hypothetical protein [Dyadobacter sp. CY327]